MFQKICIALFCSKKTNARQLHEWRMRQYMRGVQCGANLQVHKYVNRYSENSY